MIPLAFITASIAAELDDWERLLRHQYNGELPPTPFAQLKRISRIRALLAEAERHCEPDDVVRERLMDDSEPHSSSDRDTREST